MNHGSMQLYENTATDFYRTVYYFMWSVIFPYKWLVMRSFDAFFDISLDNAF